MNDDLSGAVHRRARRCLLRADHRGSVAPDFEVVRENDHSYIVPGNMDVDRLDELFGMRPAGRESATVAGLVSELAGRIPQKGEVVEEDGLRFEVLHSTERRVEQVRISVARPSQMKLI